VVSSLSEGSLFIELRDDNGLIANKKLIVTKTKTQLSYLQMKFFVHFVVAILLLYCFEVKILIANFFIRVKTITLAKYYRCVTPIISNLVTFVPVTEEGYFR
jgi:hypothetical protein